MQEYTGWKVWVPTDEELVELYQNNNCSVELKENEYLIIKDSRDGTINSIYKKKNGKMEKINRAAIKIKDPKDGRMNKTFNPRNPEQACAFDMMHDPDTTVKLITGSWGTGKTMMLVTAALEALKDKRFEKIVWIRNNVEVKDTEKLGALPGDIYEKLKPFLGPFIDHVGSMEKVEKMIKEGQLEVEPLQSLRGRNIDNAIIMCSEAENLTKEHIQLILARAAEGSNVWIDGDTRQRDKVVFEKSQGLEYLIEGLKGDELFSYVHLIKKERSKTAALADKLDKVKLPSGK